MDDTVRLSRSARRYISGITDSGRVVVTRYAPDPSSRPNRLTDGEDDSAEAISDEVPWRSLNSTAFALPNRRFRFSGVSICTIRPWLITAIRLQRYSASSRMWVVKKIVRPCRTSFLQVVQDTSTYDRIQSDRRLVEE